MIAIKYGLSSRASRGISKFAWRTWNALRELRYQVRDPKIADKAL